MKLYIKHKKIITNLLVQICSNSKDIYRKSYKNKKLYDKVCKQLENRKDKFWRKHWEKNFGYKGLK